MISVFDLFKIGIGPSSSHTVGPMRAAHAFRRSLVEAGLASRTGRLQVTLFGSLAWTGRGHATDKAVVLGLAGMHPESADPDEAAVVFTAVTRTGRLRWTEGRTLHFDLGTDLVFDLERLLPRHSHAMTLAAFEPGGEMLLQETWYSIGGGFVLREGDDPAALLSGTIPIPFEYRTGAELLSQCESARLSIAEIVLANECALRPRGEVMAGLDRVADAMFACIERGLLVDGELPGGLKVKRRARDILRKLNGDHGRNQRLPLETMDYVSVYAIAVNEENAAGGRVVTAPTNGAAGVIPAVLRYYRDHCPGASAEGIHAILLTAAAIGGLFKMNASISGAEVGCQGEVGVACSMAAAGLAAALGGTNAQVENAAEIGMEHHLGLTCDPVGGLVQIPCIERNAFGAVKAINAASLALRGDGIHRVSLDQVIATMRQTGADLQAKYKETALGGLAVNVPEC